MSKVGELASGNRTPMVLTCVLVSLLGLVGLVITLSGVHEALGPADCIIIPGHRSYADGTCGASLRARTLHAVSLYQRGLSGWLLFTGGLGKPGSREAEAGARLAIASGVPPECVLVEPHSRTTWENFHFASQIMRARGLSSCLISTEPYHILRCRLVARRLGLVARAAPAMDSPGFRLRGYRLYYTVRECFSLLSYLTGVGPGAARQPSMQAPLPGPGLEAHQGHGGPRAQGGSREVGG